LTKGHITGLSLLRSKCFFSQHAIIDELVIPFAAYTAVETPNAFQ